MAKQEGSGETETPLERMQDRAYHIGVLAG